jgi:hypothetical protein
VISEDLARRIFEQAIAEQRAAELLEALFGGAAVTLDSVTERLVIVPLEEWSAA